MKAPKEIWVENDTLDKLQQGWIIVDVKLAGYLLHSKYLSEESVRETLKENEERIQYLEGELKKVNRVFSGRKIKG